MAEAVADDQKLSIVKRLISEAPPGEFKEVVNDVRTLLNDDTLVQESLAESFAEYSRDQLVSVKIDNSEQECLITDANDLKDGRFFDPRSKQSFRVDHVRNQASEFEAYETDEQAESWRAALEKELTTYAKERYPSGTCTVVGTSQGDSITLQAFIESHKFEAKNFWNGRWRSKWSITFEPNQGEAELTGNIKSQIHYFEDGNVQLMTDRDVNEKVTTQNEASTGKDIVRIIRESEDTFQQSINENYQSMSDSTFKTLRRQLPMTKQKIDWNKMAAYTIASGLKNAS